MSTYQTRALTTFFSVLTTLLLVGFVCVFHVSGGPYHPNGVWSAIDLGWVKVNIQNGIDGQSRVKQFVFIRTPWAPFCMFEVSSTPQMIGNKALHIMTIFIISHDISLADIISITKFAILARDHQGYTNKPKKCAWFIKKNHDEIFVWGKGDCGEDGMNEFTPIRVRLTIRLIMYKAYYLWLIQPEW